MKLVIKGHALDRLKLRNISEEDIEYVLRNQLLTFPGENEATAVQGAFPNGNVLRVWVLGSIPLVEPFVIKSAAWVKE
jgi:hypothetical protein